MTSVILTNLTSKEFGYTRQYDAPACCRVVPHATQCAAGVTFGEEGTPAILTHTPARPCSSPAVLAGAGIATQVMLAGFGVGGARLDRPQC